jgi:hypothetical protein
MLITEAYREQNRLLHESNPNYGAGAHRWREKVRQLSSWGRLGILDYASGKGTLAKALGPAYTVAMYDPAFPEHAATPEPAPVVFCGDALEHIEPQCLNAVLADLWRVTVGKGLFVVHLGPAKKTLPDGRNTHLIQKPPAWWQETLAEAGFRILEVGLDSKDAPKEASFVVERAVQ